jgi:hypothetical protein
MVISSSLIVYRQHGKARQGKGACFSSHQPLLLQAKVVRERQLVNWHPL